MSPPRIGPPPLRTELIFSAERCFGPKNPQNLPQNLQIAILALPDPIPVLVDVDHQPQPRLASSLSIWNSLRTIACHGHVLFFLTPASWHNSFTTSTRDFPPSPAALGALYYLSTAFLLLFWASLFCPASSGIGGISASSAVATHSVQSLGTFLDSPTLSYTPFQPFPTHCCLI